VAYGLLLCLGLFTSTYKHGSATAISNNISDATDTIPHYLASRFGSNWTTALETFALATSLAAATFLSTYTLYFAPLEIFIFSRFTVILAAMVLTNYFNKIETGPSKAIFPAVMLCLGTLMAAYRPNIPGVWTAKWTALFSSVFAALWPFQLKEAFQSPGNESQSKYQMIRRGASKLSSNLEALPLLQDIVLLAVVVLTPLLVFSGEIGHISRNCYFLKVPDFWIYLFSGAAFRFILLISSAIFIKSTSVLNFIILTVLIEVSQIVHLTYSDPLSSQWLALALCLLCGVWFYHLDRPLSSSTIPNSTSASSLDLETRWTKNLCLNGSFESMMRFVTIGIFITGCFQLFRERNSQPTYDKRSPTSHRRDKSIPKLLRGTDHYLGQRPHPNSIANLPMLIEQCRGTYEHLENMYDIHRCLDFLSTEQDKYLSTSLQMRNSLDAAADAYMETNSSNIQSPGTITIKSDSESTESNCEGEIVPYHIWWTGLPAWRIELFIKSYFYTQNLACSRLWIWVNSDHHPGAMDAWLRHPRFKRFAPLISRGDIILKEWKLPSRVPLPAELDELDQARYYTHPGRPNAKGERLVADSIIRDSSGQDWVQIYKEGDEPQLIDHTVGVSDAARLIILHLHGGVYMDPDMLLLRDLRPLLLNRQGFAERWGTKTDPAAYNNGFLHIPANSTISSYLLLGGTRMGLVYHFLALGRMLVQENRGDKDVNNVRAMLKLENAFFDPMWVENDGKRVGRCSVPCVKDFEQLFKNAPMQGEWASFDGEPLKGSTSGWNENTGDGLEIMTVNRTLENFYRGAYTVHLHNLWGMQYELGSWIDVITRAHDGFFKGERTNPYGERWNRPKIEGYLGGMYSLRQGTRANIWEG